MTYLVNTVGDRTERTIDCIFRTIRLTKQRDGNKVKHTDDTKDTADHQVKLTQRPLFFCRCYCRHQNIRFHAVLTS